MPNKTIESTTQQFLDIFDITNNLVIMKDGTTSIILSIDAMNFGLLAEEEQDSIMYAYAGLLNSLNYPIQILIRSQTKDVTGYLQLLKDQEDSFQDRKRQIRIQKYREFVTNLIRERNVLDKKFFVAIPAQPVELGILPASSVLPGKGTININSVDRNLILEKAKNILEPKKDHLIAQFARIGLYSRQLDTQEIIQLFYLNYNPKASDGQQITNSSDYSTPLVTAKIEKNMMNQAPSPINQQSSTDLPTSASTNSSDLSTSTPVNPPNPPTSVPTNPPAPTSIIPPSTAQIPDTQKQAGGSLAAQTSAPQKQIGNPVIKTSNQQKLANSPTNQTSSQQEQTNKTPNNQIRTSKIVQKNTTQPKVVPNNIVPSNINDEKLPPLPEI